MRNWSLALLLVLTALTARAGTGAVRWSPAARQIVLARRAAIEGWDAAGRERLWSTRGVDIASFMAVDRDSGAIAVVDSINDSIVLTGNGGMATRTIAVGATPVAALFERGFLFVACRDSKEIWRISSGGRTDTLPSSGGVTRLAATGSRLYAYSTVEGTIDAYTFEPFRPVASAVVASFASDLDADEHDAYLPVPGTGKVDVVDLKTLKIIEHRSVGAVPTAVALEGRRSALTAGVVAVADPSSKRIWRSDRSESMSAAAGRGFVRGLLGLGLYTPRSADFPTGVDRLRTESSTRLAFDSSSGSLYLLEANRPRLLARGVGAAAFDARPGAAIWWDGRTLQVSP